MSSEDEKAAREAIKARVIHCPAPQALKDHTREFEKKVYEVTDGVHVAVGYAIANSILVEAPKGLIVIDTTESTVSMQEIWQQFRKISDKPLKGIIYTHSHKDHMGGTEAVLEGNEKDIDIWAHKKFLAIRETYDTLLKGAMTPRNVRQFGLVLSPMGGLVNCGIGPLLHTKYSLNPSWPNRIMEGEGVQDINIAGLDMQLVYIPGETECQMGVWIPSKKVFMPGDNFYKTFPNLYAIRGTVPRSVTNWVKSLDIMRKLKPEHLAPSHTRPVSGQAKIQTELTNYRDAIQFVHDQTLRLMNRGLHPVDVAKAIKLPPSLRDNPFLQSFYGTPEWSSRAVFDAYIGWFSGNPEELFPLSPTERGKRMVKSFGSEKIVQEAKSALEEGDIQWGLELSTNAFLCDPSNEAAKELRTQAILSLAAQQTSANGRNYLLTYLLEDHNIAPRLYPAAKVVLDMPLDIVFKRMAFSIKAENVEDVVSTAVVTFKDLGQAFSFHIRNCVLEVDDADSAKRDLSFTMTSTDLREVLAGQKTIQDLVNEHKIESDKQDGEVVKFFSYFETGDEFMKSK